MPQRARGVRPIAQPDMPVGILRPCPACNNVMLLMSVIFQTEGVVVKQYECFTCKTVEAITAPVFE